MQLPLQIAFHGLDRSEDLVWNANRLVQRLESICGDLIACRIAISQRGLNRQSDQDFTVFIDVLLPTRETIVASRHHHDDASLAMHVAFEAVKREAIERKGRSQIGAAG